ncbi:MAG: tryptophan-rich sensory protein [Flavobacteriales bacterium]|nr:tryptophan-rich sensory protein [Flavobacteriales bacterium]MCB9194068.1 tryptophan-rich sensory protein [Flavobacteriales bacterium]
MRNRTLLFLLLNFGALAIGGLFTGPGVTSAWYLGLAKAPWTPPGWVFGAAWSTLMLCFAFFMARITADARLRPRILLLFAAQWVLNVAWNPVFFQWHLVLPALVLIVALEVVVALFLFRVPAQPRVWRLLVLPYFLWLLMAISLNAYILVKN